MIFMGCGVGCVLQRLQLEDGLVCFFFCFFAFTPNVFFLVFFCFLDLFFFSFFEGRKRQMQRKQKKGGKKRCGRERSRRKKKQNLRFKSWAGPVSLAVTKGILVSFFSSAD